MTNKKKAWYDLLEQYNRLIKEKEYNKNLVNTEFLEGIKEKILHYLREDAIKRAEAEAQMLAMDISKQGFKNTVAKNMVLGSWVVKWAVKADNIIAAVNEEHIIAKEDMENSYYGLRFFGGFSKSVE